MVLTLTDYNEVLMYFKNFGRYFGFHLVMSLLQATSTGSRERFRISKLYKIHKIKKHCLNLWTSVTREPHAKFLRNRGSLFEDAGKMMDMKTMPRHNS